MAIQGKMLSLFREMSIGKINNCYCQIFPHTDFLIKPFLILLKPTRSINKWIGWHITKEREKHIKNDQILSLHLFLASFFTRRPIQALAYGLYYSGSFVSLLTKFKHQHIECKEHSSKWTSELIMSI